MSASSPLSSARSSSPVSVPCTPSQQSSRNSTKRNLSLSLAEVLETHEFPQNCCFEFLNVFFLQDNGSAKKKGRFDDSSSDSGDEDETPKAKAASKGDEDEEDSPVKLGSAGRKKKRIAAILSDDDSD